MIISTVTVPLVLLLLEPFAADFVLRAAAGGVLVAVICGVVGTWVVIRGMAFFGEAIGHGMLPGVALATVAGFPVMLGGAASAAAMSVAIGALQRRGRLSYDTTIGLLFVSMLSLGVVIVSHSGSFATDATALLFGDILAVGEPDLWLLAAALAVTLAVAATFHRAFVATAFDPRIAVTLGCRPGLAQSALVGLVTLAVVASFQAVGTLLVVALLLGPVVAANRWTRRIVPTMVAASAFGSAAVLVGLTVSWYVGTAAGSSIAFTAIALAAASALVRAASTAVLARIHTAATHAASTHAVSTNTASAHDARAERAAH